MAELLIKVADNTHVDPIKDMRGSYKRGDVVAVMPDGHVWGRREGLPVFVVVRIPDVTVTQAMKYLDAQTQVDQFTGQTVQTRRRLYRIRLDDVPVAVRNALRTTGSITLTWNQIRNYVQNKVTLEAETQP